MPVVSIDPIFLALISAASGALVSSVFTFAGQALERRAKRKEIIFNAAIAQAKQRITTGLELVRITGRKAAIPDETILAGQYYSWLRNLYDHGCLPPEAIEAEKASVQKMQEAEKQREETERLNRQRVFEEATKNPLMALSVLTGDPTNRAGFSADQLAELQKTSSKLIASYGIGRPSGIPR